MHGIYVAYMCLIDTRVISLYYKKAIHKYHKENNSRPIRYCSIVHYHGAGHYDIVVIVAHVSIHKTPHFSTRPYHSSVK